MFIESYSNGAKVYLRLVHSVRVSKPDGSSVSKKKVILSLGALENFDDGKPNYLDRLKQSFKDGKPLIPELLPFVEEQQPEIFTVTFQAGDPHCFGRPKCLAPCILDPVFSALGLDQFFAVVKHHSKLQYDLQGIVRLLTYGRILDPASKIATMRQNDSFYQPLVNTSNDDNVYDVLDLIYENKQKIIQRMNSSISKGIGRNTSMAFYDVTNFFFEIEDPDEDVLDDDGNVLESGLRKMGVSKENRKQPIVQMGLFLDDNGIPISIESFPGNTLDHLTLRTAMKNTIDTLNLDRFILVADRGMYSGTNMCHVLNQGDGYIVSKTIKKSTKNDRKWILDPEGYTVKSPDFKYKSRIVERKVTDEDGSEREIKEKQVVYWSKAFYLREKHENESFLSFIEKLKENPHGFRVTAAQSRSLKKFLKKDVVNKATGEVLDSKKLLAMIDDEKLTEFNELMGYYQIVSSELDMPDLEIIEKYHGLTRIEDQFREMKGTLATRPIFVNTPEHIQAHLLICFIALTIMRILQYKIKSVIPDDLAKDLNWSYGLPGHRLAEALRSWSVDELPGDLFRMQNADAKDLQLILKALHVDLPLKLYSRGDLRSLKSSVQIF